MLVYEAKLQGTQAQYRRLDEAIRTGLLFGTPVFVTGWMGWAKAETT